MLTAAQIDTTAVQTKPFKGREALHKFAQAVAALATAPLQAELDRLMLEHCPNEMSDTQRALWAANQQPAKETTP